MASVIRRDEMLEAKLKLGGVTIDLAEYATTGLTAVAVGPRGNGKTNAGLLMAEQLSAQGWVSVLIDPEAELASLYGKAVAGPDELRAKLLSRDQPILVVNANDASEFVPYGRVILEVSDQSRKPVFVVIDEGQMFSNPKLRQGDAGESADIINDIFGRGRKRALDVFVTALRVTGTLHRAIFANKNLTLMGCQEDATSWSSLAPLFKASKIEFGDLAALAPGEFFCMSRRGVEKVRLPMAAALARVAMPAPAVKKVLPATFSQWDKAMRNITLPRLQAITPDVVELLSSVAGLSTQQVLAGRSALADEIEVRN